MTDTADAIHMQIDLSFVIAHATHDDDGVRPERDSSLTGNPCVIFGRTYAENDESNDFRVFCQTSYYQQRRGGTEFLLYHTLYIVILDLHQQCPTISTYFCNCFFFLVFTLM